MKATQKPPPPACDVQVTPAHILRGAAHYLQTNGWIKGSLFDTSMNPGPVFPPACPVAAICTAATGQPATPDNLPAGPDGRNALHALGVLAEYLWRDGRLNDGDFHGGLPCANHEIVADWNDHADRTFDEVKTVLNDAATEWDILHPAVTR